MDYLFTRFILGLGAHVFHVNSVDTYAPQKLHLLRDASTDMWPFSTKPYYIFSM